MRASPFNPKKTIVTIVSGVGDGFGPKADRTHKPHSDEIPATGHGGKVNVDSEQVINTGCTTVGEELQQSTRPKLNALNEERNSIQKPPTAHDNQTDHDMQLIGDDSDINNIQLGDNVFEEITQNLRSPIHAELNGVISGDINQSVPNQTELKGDTSRLINANQNSAFSGPNVPRRWKRIERVTHARNCCPNSQENTTNKRNRDEEDMDQPDRKSVV